MSELLQRGQFPLWNPYLHAGVPFLANMREGIFYPSALLFRFLGIVDANRIFLLLHFFLAGFMGFLAARAMNLGRAGSLLFSVILSFNGFFFLHGAYFNHFAGITWILPVLMFVQKPPADWRFAAALAVMAFCLQFLSGNPFFVYASLLLAIWWDVYKRFFSRERNAFPAKRWGWTFLSLALLSAVQALPFIESVLNSPRADGLTFEKAMHFSEPPAQLARFLIQPLWSWSGFDVDGDPTITGFYVGILCLVLGVLGIFRSKDPATKFWLGVALASAVLSFGTHLPGYNALWKIMPGLKFFRFPAQWLCLLVPALAFLAARGLGYLNVPLKRAMTVLVLAELFLFASKSPFGIVQAEFFSLRTPTVDRLLIRDPLPRISHIGKGYVQLTTAQDWREAQLALVPNLSLPYHIRSNSGYGSAETRLRAESLAKSLGSPDGFSDWMQMSASKILCVFRKEGERKFASVIVSTCLPRLALYDAEDPISPASSSRALKPVFESETRLSLSLPIVEKATRLHWADSFYPGWQVFLDGKKGGILPTDDGLIYVNVPANSREAIFVFRPISFGIGTALSLMALLALILPTGSRLQKLLADKSSLPPQNASRLQLQGPDGK